MSIDTDDDDEPIQATPVKTPKVSKDDRNPNNIQYHLLDGGKTIQMINLNNNETVFFQVEKRGRKKTVYYAYNVGDRNATFTFFKGSIEICMEN